MSSPKNVTLGEYIYTNIDSNEYLQEIYRCILINYSAKLFDDATIKKTTFNLDHALRFADVLSKSSDTPNSEKHKTWAQEIVALLNFLYVILLFALFYFIISFSRRFVKRVYHFFKRYWGFYHITKYCTYNCCQQTVASKVV